jgi:hypothetical protein
LPLANLLIYRAMRANSPGCMRGGAAGWHEGCLRTVPLAARTSARCGYLQTAGQRSSRMGHKTQLYLNEPGRRSRCRAGRRRGPNCRGSRGSGKRQMGRL